MPSRDNAGCGGTACDGIALQFEPTLDTRGEIIFRDTWLMLQAAVAIASPNSNHHGDSVVEVHALLRYDAGGSGRPSLSPISITQAGMCAEAANTAILPSTRLMIESNRPVL